MASTILVSAVRIIIRHISNLALDSFSYFTVDPCHG